MRIPSNHCPRTLRRYNQDWSKRSLAHRSYAYVWADGVYFNVRLEDTDNKRQCIRVLMGATRDGTKELIAITDGYRESEQSESVPPAVESQRQR